jgi:hypothetical protein
METKETIRLKWDAQSKTGSVSLFLKMNILRKYALPPMLHSYNKEHEIGIIVYPYNTLKEFEGVKKEIEEYITLVGMHHLPEDSKFHSSHILYLLVNYMGQKNVLEHQQEVKRRLHNRIYLLKRLMHLDDYKDFNIDIYDAAKGTFKYHFGAEPVLKRSVIRYVIREVTTQLRQYDRKLYSLLMSGATEDELEQAVQRQTDYQINKVMVAELAKKIVRYLNNENTILHNPNQKDELSISNAQGEFIYDIFTVFHIYEPKQHSNKTVVKHHDTIRKLIKRSAILDEDKQELK